MRTNVVVLFIFIIRNIRINVFIVLDLFYVCIMNLKVNNIGTMTIIFLMVVMILFLYNDYNMIAIVVDLLIMTRTCF